MRRNRIAEQWDSYAREVLEDAPPIQKQECRRAFYAGAWAFYSIQLTQISDGVGEPLDEDLQLMADLCAELEDFKTLVATGRT